MIWTTIGFNHVSQITILSCDRDNRFLHSVHLKLEFYILYISLVRAEPNEITARNLQVTSPVLSSLRLEVPIFNSIGSLTFYPSGFLSFRPDRVWEPFRLEWGNSAASSFFFHSDAWDFQPLSPALFIMTRRFFLFFILICSGFMMLPNTAQALNLCRSIDQHQVCIVSIKRSAKNFWEYNAAVSIDGKRGPKEPYNCRSHYKTQADGSIQYFEKSSIGALVCRAYRPLQRNLPQELNAG